MNASIFATDLEKQKESLLDLRTRTTIAELDLRPKKDAATHLSEVPRVVRSNLERARQQSNALREALVSTRAAPRAITEAEAESNEEETRNRRPSGTSPPRTATKPSSGAVATRVESRSKPASDRRSSPPRHV